MLADVLVIEEDMIVATSFQCRVKAAKRVRAPLPKLCANELTSLIAAPKIPHLPVILAEFELRNIEEHVRTVALVRSRRRAPFGWGDQRPVPHTKTISDYLSDGR